MDLICDTNVWYQIARGERSPQALKRGGHRLLATPTSFIEIASVLTEESLEWRRAAAKAVVDTADEILVDVDRHFAALWGIEVEPLAIDWRDAFKGMAMAANLQELSGGVEDALEGVVRTVRPDIAQHLRQSSWPSFVGDVERAVDNAVPGYSAARKAKRITHADKRSYPKLRQELLSVEAQGGFILATRARACLNTPCLPGGSWQESGPQAVIDVQPYAAAYAQYLYECATRYAPDKNDWGDLECFAYLQGDRRLLTRDKRWLDIAKDAGLAEWVFDPEA